MIVFNTNRQYSNHGQRIAAEVLPDRRFMFADVDRNIDGITSEAYPYTVVNAVVLQSWLMREYDHGRITYGAHTDYTNSEQMESEATLMQALKDKAMSI
jgi:hypothetical protein